MWNNIEIGRIMLKKIKYVKNNLRLVDIHFLFLSRGVLLGPVHNRFTIFMTKVLVAYIYIYVYIYIYIYGGVTEPSIKQARFDSILKE